MYLPCGCLYDMDSCMYVFSMFGGDEMERLDFLLGFWPLTCNLRLLLMFI